MTEHDSDMDEVVVKQYTRKRPDKSNVKQPEVAQHDRNIAVPDTSRRSGVKILSKNEGTSDPQTRVETGVVGNPRTSYDDKRHS